MEALKQELIERVAEALRKATPNQIYLLLETIQNLTKGSPGD